MSAHITFYELDSYNSGHLIPFTIDLEILNDHEEYRDAIKDILARIKATAPQYNCEEWIVADHEGIPESMVSEYDLSPEYWEYKDQCEQYGAEVVTAAMRCEADLDHYMGHVDHFGSDDQILGEWAEQNDFLGDIPPKLAPYIDWESVGRDLNCNGWTVVNGHVFSV